MKYSLPLLFLLLTTTAAAQLPVIEIQSVTTNAAKPGSEFDLRVSQGSRTDEINALRFSHPGITAKVKTTDPLPFSEERRTSFGNFHVKVAPDVPLGRYEVRALGRHGISNPRAFLVHAIEHELVVTPSHSRDEPTELPPNTLLHTTATDSNVDYYQFTVIANQEQRIDFLATGLDSRMIGQLDLLDSNGRVIQTARGSDELDPHLTVPSADSDQKYGLAVRDILYRGGEPYAYHLILRSAQNASELIPSATTRPQLARRVTDYASLLAKAKTAVEQDAPESIDLPAKIAAKFDSRNDTDQYEFSANEGDTFAIDVISERLGQPTDARFFVERSEPQESGDPIWKEVVKDDDSHDIKDGILSLYTRDPYLIFKAPSKATYRLTVRDLDKGESLSKSQSYWLDLRKPDPGFELVAYHRYPSKDGNAARQHGSHIVRGGTESLRVFAIRRDDWKGSIEISVEGLPDGVTCRPATIAADRNQVELVLAAKPDAPRSVTDIRVVGKAKVSGNTETSVTAVPITTQWGKGGGRDFVRLRRTNTLTLAVSDQDAAVISVDFGSDAVLELKKGGELKLPIKLTRREGSKDSEYILRPKDLPPKVTAGEVKIAKDKSEAELVLKAAGDAPTGTYSLWLQSETKIKVKPNPQALTRAQAYRDHLQKLHDDAANADKIDAIKAAIAEADKQVEAAKGNANPQDITTYDPAPHITIRIIE